MAYFDTSIGKKYDYGTP